ncbi:hypothetical protein [Humidesulfovibrio idahonensis]
MFGDGSYSSNIIQGGVVLQPQPYMLAGELIPNCIVITGAATVAPDAETGAAVFSCQNIVLIGASASLTSTTNCKGLVGFANDRAILLNGAQMHMDYKGKAGNFGDTSILALCPARIKRRVKSVDSLAAFVVLGEGAEGGAGAGPVSSSAFASGIAGAAAKAMQTGGGGSGVVAGAPGPATSGAGGKGGPFCGGAASSGYVGNGVGNPAGKYGGPGSVGTEEYGVCCNSGAGDPPGTGGGNRLAGTGAGGGLLALFAAALKVSSGCRISADGSPSAGANGFGAGTIDGGAAGGGCVCICTKSGGYSNGGTVRASGGAGTYASSYGTGGAGGVGSVNIFQAA